jgi:hypothetical protein
MKYNPKKEQFLRSNKTRFVSSKRVSLFAEKRLDRYQAGWQRRECDTGTDGVSGSLTPEESFAFMRADTCG